MSTTTSMTAATSPHDPQLIRLADAIAQKVGPQRFKVWFNPGSTKLDLRHDALEIADLHGKKMGPAARFRKSREWPLHEARASENAPDVV